MGMCPFPLLFNFTVVFFCFWSYSRVLRALRPSFGVSGVRGPVDKGHRVLVSGQSTLGGRETSINVQSRRTQPPFLTSKCSHVILIYCTFSFFVSSPAHPRGGGCSQGTVLNNRTLLFYSLLVFSFSLFHSAISLFFSFLSSSVFFYFLRLSRIGGWRRVRYLILAGDDLYTGSSSTTLFSQDSLGPWSHTSLPATFGSVPFEFLFCLIVTCLSSARRLVL